MTENASSEKPDVAGAPGGHMAEGSQTEGFLAEGSTAEGSTAEGSMAEGRLDALVAAVGGLEAGAAAPVHLWDPPFCGDIDMRIAADGTWFYAGTPITRQRLVRLFASVLRKDADRFVLVTPAERVGIIVEDAPFAAVAMTSDGGRLRFITNVGDEVQADTEHPLRFEVDADGGVKPYVLVRDQLWARLTRSLAIELLDRVEEGGGTPAIRSGHAIFPLPA